DQHYWGLHSFYWGIESASRGVSGDRYEVNSSGLWAERIGGKWFARFVLEGSPAARAGVLAGDELVALDGAEFHPLAFASSASELTVSSDGRTTRTVEIRPIRQSLNRAFDEAARASQKILAVDGKRLGVFHVWSGSAEIRRALAEALAEFEAQQVDALLLDFCGGYGGMTEAHIAPLRESAY